MTINDDAVCVGLILTLSSSGGCDGDGGGGAGGGGDGGWRVGTVFVRGMMWCPLARPIARPRAFRCYPVSCSVQRSSLSSSKSPLNGFVVPVLVSIRTGRYRPVDLGWSLLRPFRRHFLFFVFFFSGLSCLIVREQPGTERV